MDERLEQQLSELFGVRSVSAAELPADKALRQQELQAALEDARRFAARNRLQRTLSKAVYVLTRPHNIPLVFFSFLGACAVVAWAALSLGLFGFGHLSANNINQEVMRSPTVRTDYKNLVINSAKAAYVKATGVDPEDHKHVSLSIQNPAGYDYLVRFFADKGASTITDATVAQPCETAVSVRINPRDFLNPATSVSGKGCKVALGAP